MNFPWTKALLPGMTGHPVLSALVVDLAGWHVPTPSDADLAIVFPTGKHSLKI